VDNHLDCGHSSPLNQGIVGARRLSLQFAEAGEASRSGLGAGVVEERWTMTIVGKILTILVFLMSLATGAFFVIDYTTRTNWKAAYETLQREMVVANTNN